MRTKIEHTAGFGYDLTMDVTDCNSGRSLAVFKGHADTRDTILDTVDDLSRRARVKLGEPNSSLDRFNVPLMEETTFSMEALKDFNTGSVLGGEGKLVECMASFQKAVDIDPKFAMAQASLGTAYYDLGSMEKAAVYYKKAFDLSGNVSQWEKYFIRSGYYMMAEHDLRLSAENWEQWSRVYPDDETAFAGLSNAETQIGAYDRAIEAGEKSLKSGQVRPELNYWILANAYKAANRFSDAKRVSAEAQEQGKDARDFTRSFIRSQ